MKVIIAVLGAFACAVLSALFLAPMAADWYTARSEFQSPDEFEETYMLIYFVTIGAGLLFGYVVGRIVGGKVAPG
ncbi:MAG: hypothetical protein AAFQ35_11645 [Pseudomonadota bacterium]